jgi:hypothetical protein
LLHRVRQVRLTVLGDAPDFELPYGYARVATVKVSVHSGAGLELEDFVLLVYGPDASESSVDVAYQDLRALLQALAQALRPRERHPHFSHEFLQTVSFSHFGFCALVLGGVNAGSTFAHFALPSRA